jgi:class 3 adenylate cyclase
MSERAPSDASAMALKFLSGPEAGRVVLVKTPMRFGRNRDNSICLSYDHRISRYHAEIRAGSDGSHQLADLGSTNGSIYGDRVLTGDWATITPGDTFCLGSTNFLFDWSDQLMSPSRVVAVEGTMLQKTTNIDAAALGKSQTEAVLIADMRSSTSLGGQLGENRMLRLKQNLFDILQRAAHRHRTQFTKPTGDGHMMTFATLTDATAATRVIIGETARHNASPGIVHPLHLRLSLTLGETMCDHVGDRHGQAVNLAFRLISLQGLPGEMPGEPDADIITPLVTPTDLIATIQSLPWDPSPPDPIDLPPQEIKGFDEPIPVSVFQLRPDVGSTA